MFPDHSLHGNQRWSEDSSSFCSFCFETNWESWCAGRMEQRCLKVCAAAAYSQHCTVATDTAESHCSFLEVFSCFAHPKKSGYCLTFHWCTTGIHLSSIKPAGLRLNNDYLCLRKGLFCIFVGTTFFVCLVDRCISINFSLIMCAVGTY